MLQYSLNENHLNAMPNSFVAQAVNVRTFSLSEIIHRIMERNPDFSQAQINAPIDDFIREVCLIIAGGGAVNTPLFNMQPSITGVFHGLTDEYDKRRHRVSTNFTQGTALRRAVSAIKPQKVASAEPIPYILEVQDIISQTSNGQITPAGVLQIWGGNLKIATENLEDGVFLIDDKGKAVKMPFVIENKPSRLIVMTPTCLAEGTYSIEVRTTANTADKTLKIGRFNKELVSMKN
jgi:hypothetical protein